MPSAYQEGSLIGMLAGVRPATLFFSFWASKKRYVELHVRNKRPAELMTDDPTCRLAAS